jgi:coenzyme F420-dependent glucose-6-phosphate dehydrogenase
MTAQHNVSEGQSVGYWASQEQYSMEDLLNFTIEAEKNGFTDCMTSDHFHPWSHTGGHGNFTWVWIAAAAERTSKMKFITGVTATVYRYNPAIVAQAFASLDVLYPGRIGLGVGSGEAMNEVSLGFDWPSGEVRLERTKESIQIIQSLWKGTADQAKTDKVKEIDNDGFVTYQGKFLSTKKARLYTPPKTNIPLYMAAVGEEATKIAATFTDGLITVAKPNKSDEIFQIFDKQAKLSRKDPTRLEKIGKPRISYNKDYDKAFHSCEFWRTSSLKDAFELDINDPRELEKKAKREVSDEKLKQSILITTNIEECIRPIEEYFKAGFTKIYVQSTSPNETEFIDEFSKKVLPHFENNKGKQ